MHFPSVIFSTRSFAKIMVISLTGCGVCSLGGFLFAFGQAATGKDLNALSMEVAAMEKLDALAITPRQLEMLAYWAPKTAERSRRRQPAKASPKFHKAIRDLHDALALKKDEDIIADREFEVAELRESEKPVLDDDFETTEAARNTAPDFYRLFKVSQLAALLGSLDRADPQDLVRHALRRSRQLKGREWHDARAEAVEEIAPLLAGLDQARTEALGRQIAQLLDQAHAMTKDEFEKHEPRLRQEARKIAGAVGPTQVLENRALLELARLLSNPGLAAAVEMRQKAERK